MPSNYYNWSSRQAGSIMPSCTGHKSCNTTCPFYACLRKSTSAIPIMWISIAELKLSCPAGRKTQHSRRRGGAIIFAITIPKQAKHPALAARYIEFLLSTEGRALLTAEYMTLTDQPWTYDLENVPSALQVNLVSRNRSPAAPTALRDTNAR